MSYRFTDLDKQNAKNSARAIFLACAPDVAEDISKKINCMVAEIDALQEEDVKIKRKAGELIEAIELDDHAAKGVFLAELKEMIKPELQNG